ncbi:hypothetical protein LTR66_018000 [Elasticomyces elasticus]|nr:hypothetical protein LTR66_018000 [Elasticomyces elasticus]
MHDSSRAVNNDRNHAGLADGTAVPEDRLPRYFAKSGHAGVDPAAIKKSGGGRGNWGTISDDANDSGYAFNNQRRRSNSSTNALNDFKTKFDAVDNDPVFDEELHGATEEDFEAASHLSKQDSAETASSVDSEEVDVAHRKSM